MTAPPELLSRAWFEQHRVGGAFTIILATVLVVTLLRGVVRDWAREIFEEEMQKHKRRLP